MLEDLVTDLDAIYATLGEPVIPVAGAVFNGVFRVSDLDPLGGPPSIVGDYTLRYPLSDATLAPGDVLTIRGVQYRVADDPYRVGDGREAAVQLRAVA